MTEKILIVDDTQDLREFFADFLTMRGYKVAEAINGVKGIEAVASFQPDLILMDIMMPEMDGYEACAKIKQNPASKDIPIIFLSSLAETENKLKGFEAGGSDFFPKGGELLELEARVKAHLKIKFLTQSLKAANFNLEEKQRRLDEDLASAATIQRSLLPSEDYLKTLPLHLAWKCVPSHIIGGDIFNLFAIEDDLIAIYMVDVSGHGMSSAMITVSLAQHLQELVNQSRTGATKGILTSPKALLNNLDKEFSYTRFEKFFTLIYLVLDIKTKQLKYSLAGHPPAVLLHEDRPYELLEAGGPIIGVDIHQNFQEGSLQIQKGDKLIIYTDGTFEFENPQGDFFGLERFYDLLESNKHETAEQINKHVFDTLSTFGQNTAIRDDISFLAISF